MFGTHFRTQCLVYVSKTIGCCGHTKTCVRFLFLYFKVAMADFFIWI